MTEGVLEISHETVQLGLGMSAAVLYLLLGLRRVLKILGHNMEIDETFLLLNYTKLLQKYPSAGNHFNLFSSMVFLSCWCFHSIFGPIKLKMVSCYLERRQHWPKQA